MQGIRGDETLMARRQSKLNEAQSEFINSKMMGLNDAAAAAAAEVTSANAMMRSEKVQAELARARSEISDLTTLRRLDVIEGIMDAINMARIMADPQAMIKGWTEIAKILGHYAPEVKRIELTTGQARIRNQLEGLSDEELFHLANGGRTIAGEVTRVD